jgi:acetyl esterase/lipase
MTMKRLMWLTVLAMTLAFNGMARAADAPSVGRPETLAYGPDALQALDFWRARGTGAPAPLMVFVHGGAWKIGDKKTSSSSWQTPHFLASGFAFASINYRLVPQVGVEAQADDVAMSLKFLLDRAPSLGFDRRRVVLMGHSAGAHLSALVGTDERYLRKAGLAPADIAGVILLDGAAYDVATQMQGAGFFMRRMYDEVFGADPARQRQLSPTFHAAAPNVASFLILHVQRPDAVRQSQELGAALRTAGTAAEVQGLPGEGRSGHRDINVQLGDPSYPGTAIVDRWLAGLFAPR